MGADLIGYIVKGPVNISEDRRRAAVEVAAKAVHHCQLMVERGRAGDEEGLDALVASPIVAGLLDESGGVDLEEFMDDDCERLAELDAEEEVKEFLAMWAEGKCRDTASREDPLDPGFQIVFAGEITWGDEPEGDGYQLIKRASQLGYLDALGIR